MIETTLLGFLQQLFETLRSLRPAGKAIDYMMQRSVDKFAMKECVSGGFKWRVQGDLKALLCAVSVLPAPTLA